MDEVFGFHISFVQAMRADDSALADFLNADPELTNDLINDGLRREATNNIFDHSARQAKLLSYPYKATQLT